MFYFFLPLLLISPMRLSKKRSVMTVAISPSWTCFYCGGARERGGCVRRRRSGVGVGARWQAYPTSHRLRKRGPRRLVLKGRRVEAVCVCVVLRLGEFERGRLGEEGGRGGATDDITPHLIAPLCLRAPRTIELTISWPTALEMKPIA